MSDDEELGGPGGGEAAVPIRMLHQSGIEAGSARRSARACIWALPIRRSSTTCADAMYGAEKKQVFAPASWRCVLGYRVQRRGGQRLQSKVQSMRPVIPEVIHFPETGDTGWRPAHGTCAYDSTLALCAFGARASVLTPLRKPLA